jgi:predicted GNAT family N-acyltransferase
MSTARTGQSSLLEIDGVRLELRRARIEELVDLRHEVLRHGLPREAAIFDGDDAPTTRHYGAFDRGKAVGCATLMLNHWEGEPAWQVRGMATDARFRSRGLGAALLGMAEAELVGERSPVRLLWCNARVPAVRFYEKLGWAVRCEPFDIPTAGPHVKMTRRLS